MGAACSGSRQQLRCGSCLTNSQTHGKKIIFHPKILPCQVICDPELTLTMPRAITAGTGLDAFAHFLEGYCFSWFHPMTVCSDLEGFVVVKLKLLTV